MRQISISWAGLILGSALWLCPAQSDAQLCLSGQDCDDGDFCTTDNCILFICTHGFTCDDGDQCTSDDCNGDAELCIHGPLIGAPCEDFNPFTFGDFCRIDCDDNLVCGGCVPIFQCGDPRCECDRDCPLSLQGVCVNGACLQSTPTPTRTPGSPTATRTPSRTPTRTPTRTFTRTPTPRPAVEIQDATVREADVDVGVSFVIILSRAVDHPVVLGFTVSAGTATKGVDYVVETGNGVVITNESANFVFGSVTIPANRTASANFGVRIIGDNIIEIDETFFANRG